MSIATSAGTWGSCLALLATYASKTNAAVPHHE